MPQGRGSARKRRRKGKTRRKRPSKPVDAGRLLAAIEDAGSGIEFARIVANDPALIGPEVVAQLQDMDRQPGLEGSGRLFIELVHRARTDPQGAWEAFESTKRAAMAEGEQFSDAEEAVRDAILEGSFSEAEALSREAFEHAERYGLALVRAALHEAMADAFTSTRHGDLADNTERALAHGTEALKLAVDVEHFATLAANQGVRLVARKRGDPAENLERALELLREAVARLEPLGPSEMLARTQTNLAFNLQQRQRGERLQNLLEAEGLCRVALEFRSIERDVDNWTYSKINLASILDDFAALARSQLAEEKPAAIAAGRDEDPDPELGGLAQSRLDEAIDHLNDVIAEQERISTAWLVGHAYGSLGAIHRRVAEDLAIDERATVGPPPHPPPSEQERWHLLAGRDALETALKRLNPVEKRELSGRSLTDLGRVKVELGEKEGAVECFRGALRLLQPDLRLGSIQTAGWGLGNLMAERGDWDAAAAAFSAAIAAHERAFTVRLETVDRVREIKEMGNLSRWAAFAFAAAGDVRTALLTLETGRTRELRRRLGVEIPDERLKQLPTDARSAYEDAVAALVAAPDGQESDHAARHLQQILTEIRQLGGFADFAAGARWSEIESAVEPDWPLVYVNPTPFGTLLLAVHSQAGETRIERMALDTTSHDVFMALMFGGLDFDDPVSYLAGIDHLDDHVFPRALDETLGLLGEKLGRPLSGLLRQLEVGNVTLVPCGPIGLAPLQAASWQSESGERCLVDDFTVRTAPSALVQASALRRQARRARRQPRLVAVANPDLGDPRKDLPGAEAEVEALSALFESKNLERRERATAGFVLRAAREATHLHLACHGRGGLFDPEQSGVGLADRRLSGSELSRIDMAPQLAVLSACQTAVSAIAQTPDEVMSLATMLLAAGSEATIATLWSIDDGATALLMSRVYEEMLIESKPPAEALRTAQLWLRDLDEDAERAYLAAHPPLAAEFRRRLKVGDPPGLRGVPGTPDPRKGKLRHYAHPQYWAAFLASGAA